MILQQLPVPGSTAPIVYHSNGHTTVWLNHTLLSARPSTINFDLEFQLQEHGTIGDKLIRLVSVVWSSQLLTHPGNSIFAQ